MNSNRFGVNIGMRRSSRLTGLSSMKFNVSRAVPVVVTSMRLNGKSALCISRPRIRLRPETRTGFNSCLIGRVRGNGHCIVRSRDRCLVGHLHLSMIENSVRRRSVGMCCVDRNRKGAAVRAIGFGGGNRVRNTPQSFFSACVVSIVSVTVDTR